MLIDKENLEGSVSLNKAGVHIRLLYTLAVLSAIPLTISGSSGWVALATGVGASSRWALFVVMLFGAWRVFYIWRHSSALSTPAHAAGIGALRWLGILLMVVSVLAAASLLLQRQVAALVFGGRSDNGIEFFVLSLFASLLGSISVKGILLFELSRLMSFERWHHSFEDDSSELNACGVSKLGECSGEDELVAIRVLYGLLLSIAILYSTWSVQIFSGAGRFHLAILIPSVVAALFYVARLYSLIRWRRGFVRWPTAGSRLLRMIGLLSLFLMVASWWLMFGLSRYLGWVDDLSTRMMLLKAFGMASAVVGYGWLLFDFARLLGFERAVQPSLNEGE